MMSLYFCFLFFFKDPATTEIYTLPLHDALPISIFHLPKIGQLCRFGRGTAGVICVVVVRMVECSIWSTIRHPEFDAEVAPRHDRRAYVPIISNRPGQQESHDAKCDQCRLAQISPARSRGASDGAGQ